ncbi:hypothetical protein [Iamia sp.]|uniref:hypothetical protein n=1 Tax=Iamia sp. TaxID=2722710 RepID=UPI002BD2F45E|nr:hypothetical protein [Iamia sp.]HXH59251.1 hypothetical protein [Iamia sp.]
MANPKRATADRDRGPKESATEVWGLVRDYAKQETVDPLKGLVSFAKWGLIGSVLVGIGVIELVVVVLRVAQAEGSTALDGRWSFVPYLITLVVATVVLLLTRRAMSARQVKA